MKSLYDACEASAGIDENWVVRYARGLKKPCPELQKEIAELALPKPSGKDSHTAIILPKLCTCPHDDFSALVYNETSSYAEFPEEGLPCRVCQSLCRPSIRKPVMVCQNFFLAKYHCNELVCADCFKQKQMDDNSPGHKRRHR